MEMRKVYAETMREIMRKNDKVIILDADLAKACGTSALYAEFPERCLDCGVAEADMTSIAVGLAHYGFIPFTHSFACFAVRRTFDQIAVGVGYGKQNVKIVGTDPGICATLNGGTHMPFEDVALMRVVPDCLIFEPADNQQLKQLLPQIVEHNGPCYLRLLRKMDADLFDDSYKFDLFKATVLREGTDITIVVCGVLTADCIEVCEQLAAKGINAELICVHTIKPLDIATIEKSARKTNAVLVVENANVNGGLFGAVAEQLSRRYPCICDNIGNFDKVGEVGKLNELKSYYNMTKQDIMDKSASLVAKKD